MASSKQEIRTKSIVLINENQLFPVIFCLLLHQARHLSDKTLSNLQSSEAENVFTTDQSPNSISDFRISMSESKTVGAVDPGKTPLFTEKSSFSPPPSQDSFSYRFSQPDIPHELFTVLTRIAVNDLCPDGTKMEESGSARNQTICFSAGLNNQYSSNRNGKQKQSVRWTIKPESQSQPKSQPQPQQQRRWAA